METFVLSDFVDMPDQADRLLMEALVFEDGNSVVLLPSAELSGTAYRLSKEEVFIGAPGELIDVYLNGELTTIPMHEIGVDPQSKCAQMSADFIHQYFGMTAAERAAGRLTNATAANIKLEKSGLGLLRYGGVAAPCRGNAAHVYPEEVLIAPADKYRRRKHGVTKEWMEYAVLASGEQGIYIHSGDMTLEERGVSPGNSIYLQFGDAQRFYDWLSDPVRLRFEKVS